VLIKGITCIHATLAECGGSVAANGIPPSREQGTQQPLTSLAPTYGPSPYTYLGRDMFSSTVRRAASSAPQTSIASSLSSTTPRATVAQALSYRCHQRRFSSSKPSSPADGSKGITEGQTVPAAPAKATPDGEQKSSRASRRKAKDVAANSTVKGRDESMLHLPSVPSTQHIAPMRKFFKFVVVGNFVF
jgi:hypothetical protein